ncbi:MAG: type 4a pilus biogenesis protein PilO [Candidatus Nanopelagicales bacterium]
MSVRIWRIAAVVGSVLILLLSWLALIGPQREQAAALDLETASQQSATESLRSRVSLLKKQSEELPAQEAALAAIGQRIPASTAIPTLIRTLSGLASGASVRVTSLDPARPAPITVEQAEVPVASAPPPAEGEGEGDQGSDAVAPPPAPAAPLVQSVPLTIEVCGNFAQIRTYLGELESMRRVVAVSGLSIARGTCGDAEKEGLTARISANAFTMPAIDPAAPGTGATSATGADPATAGAT